MNRLLPAALLAVVLAACGSSTAPSDSMAELLPITVEEFDAELTASELPTVVNLWASWCIPCRSEAPLLRQAHAVYGDRVRFLGVATEDAPGDSLAFLEEFGLEFDNRSDRQGAIRGHLGAVGLPVTVFVRPGGEILRTHFGVIDDAALALGIDDLLADS
jgi:cytochrome c biogenesis protein CcmG/thiol:disulfide interchange protein DsbE